MARRKSTSDFVADETSPVLEQEPILPPVTEGPAPVKESNDAWMYYLAIIVAIIILFAVF